MGDWKSGVRGALKRFGWQLSRVGRQSLPVLWDTRCDGSPFRFWIANEHTLDWWMKPEIPVDAEMRFLKEVCRPGAIVLEAGAHHGMHTIQIARWVGDSGSVHAFELNPGNAMVLSANIGINGIGNVRVVQAAVGSTGTQLATEGERVVPGAGGTLAVTLDGYCKTHGVDEIDVVKIDVEGYEAKVLEGAQRLLATRPNISLELHLDDLERYADSLESVFRFLDLGSYSATFMMRPDWERTHPLRNQGELPERGTVNVFLKRL